MHAFYIIVFIAEGKPYYTIWYSSDTDGFITNENKLLYFNNVDVLYAFAAANNFTLVDETPLYINCDEVASTFYSPTAEISCIQTLDFWNIASDISHSTNSYFSGNSKDDITNTIYAKLFSGCNLPALKTTSREYIPQWSKEELIALKSIVQNGLTLIFNSLSLNLTS